MNRALPCVAFVLVALSACTPANTTAFNHRFADNQEADVQAILTGLPTASAPATDNATNQPLMVVSTYHEEIAQREVAAVTLEGEMLWHRPFEARTRPEILGDVVMTSDREAVVALDLRNGQELWRADLESLAYVGATRSGNTIIFTRSVGVAGGATRVGHIVAVDARSGRSKWDYEIAGVLGRPEAYGAYAFVPWDRQNVAVLEVASGLEKARLRSTDDVIAWVRADHTGLYYGGRGIYRFTGRSHTGVKTESTYREPPIPDAPRDPLVEDDSFYPLPGGRSARGRIRIYYAPEASQDPAAIPVVADRFYFVYYRYVFAFNSANELQWARMVPQDVIQGQVTQQGLFTVGEKGDLRILDPNSGADVWTGGVAEAEIELASASLDLGGWAPTPNAEAQEPAELRIALTEIAGDADNRLVPARAYAVEKLAAMEDPEISRLLLDLYAQRSMPSALKTAIGTALQSRAQGTEHVVGALDQHYDYLGETPVPPLQLIVPALLEQEKNDAVNGLVAHMLDHETPIDVLPLVIRGVVELGDESVVPALRSFLVLYRADSSFAEKPQALAMAATGIFRHGGDEGRELLRTVMGQSGTIQGLSVAINGLFERETAEAEARAQAEAAAAEEAAAQAARQERAGRPMRLSQAQINEVFVAQTEPLRGCVEQELERNPRLGQVRFVFILEAEGTARNFRFAPNNEAFVGCMQPIVGELEFPKFRQRRQRATFTINLRAGSGDETPTTSAPLARFWWSRAQYRAEQSGMGAIGRPWWEVRRAPAQAANNGNNNGNGGNNGQNGGQNNGGQNNGQGGDQPWWMQGQEGGSEGSEGSQGSQGSEGSQEGSEGSEGQEGSEGGDQPWWLPTEE